MDTNSPDGQKVFVEVRARGEIDHKVAHEWAYLQAWADESVVELLRKRLRKTEGEVRELLKSYDRFHINLTLKSNEVRYPLVDLGLQTDA